MDKLPKLTEKQQTFLLRYFSNGNNASEAYRFAYASSGTDKTVNENASKLLKNTKVTPWIEYYEANQQEAITEELKYTAQEAFLEFQDLQNRCRRSSKTYNIESKCIENKCKLAGLFKDKVEVSGGMSLANILDELQ
jgi:phage terminase small subunit